MTPRMSVVGASLRKLFAGIGGDGDYYWSNVLVNISADREEDKAWSKTALAMHMNNVDPYWANVSLAMHMDDDPHWSNVVLAMHMNGADNGTTFTDVKGKVVTPAGNVCTKTTTKKFGTASAYFDGSGDYLTAANHTDFQFGSSDYTVEAWVYLTAYPAASAWATVVSCYSDSPEYGWRLLINENGQLHYNYRTAVDAVAQGLTTPKWSIPLNTWVHVAVSKASSYLNVYIDGSKMAGTTTVYGVFSQTTPLYIGTTNSVSWFFTGYIDDVRITKGVSRYPSNFFPVARAFSDGQVIDEKGKTITVNGNAALVSTFKKFGAGSAYFDGAGDYFSLASHADFDFGSGNFTVEAWVRFSTLPSTGTGQAIMGQYIAGVAGRAWLLNCYNISGVFGWQMAVSFDGSANTIARWETTPSVDTWYHVAGVRSSTELSIYVDGVKRATADVSTSSVFAPSNPMAIGAYSDGLSNYFNGYIDDVRITKGVARYTRDFVPASAAFTDPVTSPTFLDEKGNTPVVTGTPTVSTTQSRFGGYSASFNGTTDYLTFPASASYGFNASDHTIECWVYTTSADCVIIDMRSAAAQVGMYGISGGYMSVWSGFSTMRGDVPINTGAWVHLAWVTVKGVVSMYANGKLCGQVATVGGHGLNRQIRVGADYAGANFFAGYIDDLRITNGIGRYVGEFSQRNVPFSDPYTTSPLTDLTGREFTVNGNAKVSDAVVKYGSGCMQFDGNGDYLKYATSSDFDFNGVDFTVEFWFKHNDPSATVGSAMVCSGSAAGYWQIIIGNGTARVNVFNGVFTDIVTVSVTLDTNWHHFAWVSRNNLHTLYYDGVALVATAAAALTYVTPTDLYIGANYNGGTTGFNGYLDDVQVTKGVARYVANFTPPVKSPKTYSRTLTDIHFDRVVLGLHMDGANDGNTFTDVTGKTVTAVNAVTKTAVKKFGTASAYFDGAGDYLSIANHADFNFGTGDFTIECWFMVTNTTGYKLLVSRQEAGAGMALHLAVNAGSISVTLRSPTGSDLTSFGGGAVAANVFHHVALVRSSGVATIYLNGVAFNPTASAHNLTPAAARPLAVGVLDDTTYTSYFTGYIDDLRVTKGVARYTANFTPSQLPFPDSMPATVNVMGDPYLGNLILGMHMDGADNGTVFTDFCGNTVTRTGAVTKTGTKLLGTASAYFNGTSDFLSIPSTLFTDITTADWTVEGWLNCTNPATGVIQRILGFSNSGGGNSTMVASLNTAGFPVVTVFDGAAHPGVVGLFALRPGVWYHMACVRSGTSLSMYINGKLQGTVAIVATLGAVPSPFCVGRMGDYNGQYFGGYIDDLRITKGVARYTKDFTPPGAFPDVPPIYCDASSNSVVLLMHMDGADNGTTFADDKGKTVTASGGAVTKTAIKKFGTASTYFDGVNDYLSVPNSTDFNFGTGDFTVEMWVYLAANSSPDGANQRTAGLVGGQVIGTDSWNFCISGDGTSTGTGIKLESYKATAYTVASVGGLGLSLSRWYHIAMSRSSGTLQFFVDGAMVHSVAFTSDLTIGTNLLNIGRCCDSSTWVRYLNGYIDELRITKGVARYTSKFYPHPGAFALNT